MASNKWTQGEPLSGSTTKAVIAERVYIAPQNTAYADPTKLNGSDPSAPWSDLGIVANSKVTVNYTKETRFVETGIERVRRGAYVTAKTAQATFTLEQFDAGVIEKLSGIAADAISGGKKVHIGQEDMVRKALLFVGTNKVDDKEYHTYCKDAAIVFSLADQDDARVINVTSDMFAFTPGGETVQAFFTVYVLD